MIREADIDGDGQVNYEGKIISIENFPPNKYFQIIWIISHPNSFRIRHNDDIKVILLWIKRLFLWGLYDCGFPKRKERGASFFPPKNFSASWCLTIRHQLPLSNLAFLCCFLSLNVMPSTLPLPPCSGRWYPATKILKFYFFRILKSAASKETIWPLKLSSTYPAPFIIHFHPHAVCIAKNFPVEFSQEYVVKIFVSYNYLNIRKFTPNLA